MGWVTLDRLKALKKVCIFFDKGKYSIFRTSNSELIAVNRENCLVSPQTIRKIEDSTPLLPASPLIGGT